MTKPAPIFVPRNTRRVIPAALRVAPQAITDAPEPGPRLTPEAQECIEEFRAETDALLSGVESTIKTLTDELTLRLANLSGAVVAKENLANIAHDRLRDAIAGSRNDERSRILERESARKTETILELQARLRAHEAMSAEGVGTDKSRYFGMLGNFLQDIANEMQDIGHRIEDLGNQSQESSMLGAFARRLENIALDLEEFGQNATAYSEEAQQVTFVH